MIFEHDNYRRYLKAVLADRAQRNPSYSLRAMARQLGIVGSQLSEVINGKANFSPATALKVARALELDDEETEYFCWLLQQAQESDPESRQLLLDRINRLRELRSRKATHDLTIDQFKQVAEWYHSALLELITMPAYASSPAAMAEALSISKLDVEVALERMERLELAYRDRDGAWKRRPEHIRVQSPDRNRAMRSFYRQMMQKASEALETQAPDRRLSGYETMPLSPAALPEARAAMDRFFDEISRISKKHRRQRTQVYHLFAHFFDLTPPRQRKRP